MTAPKAAETEIVMTEEEMTLTETPEPISSTSVEEPPAPGTPDEEILEEPEPPLPPSAADILSALKTLTSLQAQSGELVSEGEPGDIFLCYDICLRVHGEKPFRIHSSRQLHGILLPEGLPSATSEMETALFTITQPIKQRLMGIVGRLTAVSRGEVPKPQLGFQK